MKFKGNKEDFLLESDCHSITEMACKVSLSRGYLSDILNNNKHCSSIVTKRLCRLGNLRVQDWFGE